MSTMGDRVLNISLPKIGEKSLFTRDLEESLRNGGVDFVVHSLKDLPTVLPTGMAIGAVLEREDARDALVLRENFKGHTIQTLPKGSVIGTSSLRRTAQLRRLYSHLTVCDIRGNLNTRLAKLDDPNSKFAGIILAQAGLVRMGWMDRISQVLEPSDLLYAVGQGALAVECRANDDEVLTMLQNLMCLSTTCRILAERSFLKTLGGGCSAPVAVCSNLLGDVANMNGNNDAGLSLVGAVWSLDGHTEIRDKLGCELLDATHKRTTEMLKREADVANDHPPQKRKRNSELSRLMLPEEDDTPVINDDLQSPELAATYNMEELIGKHIHLAKKCPVVGAETEANHINNNIINNNNNANNTAPRNGGDADQLVSTSCPIKIDVGQDFMGQCPFFNSETKVALASVGKCPLTKAESTSASVDETDHAIPSTSMRLLSTLTKLSTSGGGGDGLVKSALDASHGKCPFLQKTVQMFDYSDEEQPLPHKVPLLIEDVDNLFCGLFQHKCYSRDLYSRCNRLGQQLAENLIKQGALDVMKVAQAEIHSKS